MTDCPIWKKISDLVAAYDKKRKDVSQCLDQVTTGTTNGTDEWYTSPTSDRYAGDSDVPNDLPSLDSSTTFCGDGDGLMQQLYDGIQDFVYRSALTADPSYPDPGEPGISTCTYDGDYIDDLQDYVENLQKDTSDCPEYELITSDFHTTIIGYPFTFSDVHQISVKNANYIKYWVRYYFNPPGEWRWWNPNEHSSNFALDPDNFNTRQVNVTVLPTLEGAWQQWYFEVGNDDCTVCTPIQHHTFYAPPPLDTPRPREYFRRHDDSEYSPYDSGTFDIPDGGGDVTFSGSTHTATDKVVLNVYSNGTLVQEITAGYVLGEFNVNGTINSGSNLTAEVIATSPDENFFSGFHSDIVIEP